MLSAEINALPDRVRRYIAALETECDPAGTIRENFRLREKNSGLRIECENLARASKQQEESVWAAYLGICVLRTMCRKANLRLAEQRSVELIEELGAAFPHFAGRSALR